MTFQHLAKGFSLVSFSLVVSFSVSCSQSGRTESPEAVVVSENVLSQSNNIETEDALAKEVLEAEQAWAAAFQSCDADALTALTTADFSFTDYNGMTYARHWFLETVEDCTRNVIRIEPMQVTLNDGDNTALVMSKYHQFINDIPEPVHQLMHMLVRHDGTWRVAHHHSAVMLPIGPQNQPQWFAFEQLVDGPGLSTRKAPAFEVKLARHIGDSTKNFPVDQVVLEREAVYTTLKYINIFQNCRATDLAELLSDVFLISGYNGMTYTRAYMMDAGAQCYHDLQRIEPLQIRLYGNNTAVLLGRYHQYVAGQPYDLRHITVVLFREEGVWRVAFHYSTTFNENIGSPEGKLFASYAGQSTLVSIPTPNWVVPRPLMAPIVQPWLEADGTFNYGASKELPQALEH